MRAILPFILAFLVSFTVNNSYAQAKVSAKSEIDYKQLGAPIPHFNIKAAGDKIYTEKDFSNYENLILIIFNPTCDHCIDLGKELAKAKNLPKKAIIVYIASTGMDDYLNHFAEQTGLDKVMGNQIVMGIDKTPNADPNTRLSVFLTQIFEYQLPQVNIYNKDRKMIFKQSGSIALKDIMEQIK